MSLLEMQLKNFNANIWRPAKREAPLELLIWIRMKSTIIAISSCTTAFMVFGKITIGTVADCTTYFARRPRKSSFGPALANQRLPMRMLYIFGHFHKPLSDIHVQLIYNAKLALLVLIIAHYLPIFNDFYFS